MKKDKVRLKSRVLTKNVETSNGLIEIRALKSEDFFCDDLINKIMLNIFEMFNEGYESEKIMNLIYNSMPIATRRLIIKCTDIDDSFEELLDDLLYMDEYLDIFITIIELTIKNRDITSKFVSRGYEMANEIKDIVNKNDNGLSDIDFSVKIDPEGF